MVDPSGDVRVGTEAPIVDDYTAPSEEVVTEPDNFEPLQTLEPDYQDETNVQTQVETQMETHVQTSEYVDSEEDSGEFDPIESDFDQVMGEEIQEDDDFPEDSEEPMDADFSEESSEESDVLEESDDEPISEYTDEPSEPVMEFSSQASNENLQEKDFLEDDGEEENGDAFAMASEPDPNPVDITGYANSEESNLEGGEYLYTVTVSRLDSKSLKEALKYVLIDEKLQLNHHEYMKNIKDGTVTIENLNPIKAKRIVEQLQYCDLDIKWVQKRVVMEVVEPTEMDDEDNMDEVSEDANL